MRQRFMWLLGSLSFLYILFFAFSAPAVELSGENYLEELLLGKEQITTVSKSKEDYLTAAGTVYVITEEDIRRYGWRNLREILAAVPNLDYKYDYNWMAGGQRGFTGNFSGTLLLIDGREIQNLVADEAQIRDYFPSYKIKRVEVLQGPNSTLYGTNAMQGIINIITKTGDEQPDTQEVSLLTGNENINQFGGVFRKNFSNGFSFGFSGSYFESNLNWDKLADFAASRQDYARGNDGPRRYKGRDKFNIGDKDYVYDVNIRYKDIYAGTNLRFMENQEGLEAIKMDYRQPLSQKDLRLYFAGINHEFTDILKATFEYRRQLETYKSLSGAADMTNNPATYADITKMTYLLSAYPDLQQDHFVTQLNYTPNSRHNLLLGADWRYIKFNVGFRRRNLGFYFFESDKDPSLLTSFTLVNERSKQLDRTYFVNDNITLTGKLKLVVGVSYNNRTYIHDSWLPRTSIVYQPTIASALKLTYGKGYRAPTMWELISMPTYNIAEFIPQKMDMIEGNYTQHWSINNLKLLNIFALYSMKASKTLVSAATLENPGGYAYNSFTVKGVEDLVQYKYKKASGFIGYRFVKPDKTTIAAEDVIANVPQAKVKVGVSYDVFEFLIASVFADHWDSVNIAASSFNSTSVIEKYTVPAWTAFNFNLVFTTFEPVSKVKGDLSFYVENLFNATYYHGNHRDVAPIQYLQPPRNYRVMANVKF